MFNASVTTHHFLCLRISVNGWIFGPCVNILQNVNSSLAGGEFAAAAGQLSQFWGKEKTGERGETIYTRTCTRTVCIPTLCQWQKFSRPGSNLTTRLWVKCPSLQLVNISELESMFVRHLARIWMQVTVTVTVLYLLNITVLCDVVNYDYVERHILNFMQRIHL